ncbi:putative RNA-directed DNA polymerase from transposon BS [Frankliniella fusca]|uniref:RNA-directed DNA polymerase from transposon BS n=1 Tax=Frankliniella fusca TaxID=407009 RepID=A0AAE1HDD7_9NEOP|nr:putative RNA-directed DNA polymerase from transposon BS [Frankliniella fusca]
MGGVKKHCSKCQNVLRAGVLCTKCEKWYHNYCEKRDPNLEVDSYICNKCRKKNDEAKQDVFLDCSEEEICIDEEMDVEHLMSENARLKEIVEELGDENACQRIIISEYKDEIKKLKEHINNLEIKNMELVDKGERHWTTVTPSKRCHRPGDVNMFTIPVRNKFDAIKDPDTAQYPYSPAGASPRIKRKKKILILADSQGRGCNKKLSKELKGHYQVQSVIKPGAKFQEVVVGVDKLCQDFKEGKIAQLEVILKEMIPGIICITEHHCKHNAELVTNTIDGYTVGAIYCRKIKKFGGAAILVKNGIKFKEIDLSDITSDSVFEGAAILTNDSAILSVYRAPEDNCVIQFFEKLESAMEILCKMRKIVIICGDLNIDLHMKDHKKICIKKRLENFMDLHGMHSISNQPTRVTEFSQTAIDHIITNMPKNLYVSKCNLEVGLSDHRMQLITPTQKPTEVSGPKYNFKRIFTERKEMAFIEDLKGVDWSEIYEENIVDKKFNTFHDKFMELYDKHFPLRKCKERTSTNKDWVTTGIKITSRNYRKLCSQAKWNPTDNVKSHLKIYKRIYKRVLKCAKKLSIIEEVKTSKNMSKTVWSIINKSMGKTKAPHENIKVKVDTEIEAYSDPEKVAEAFNDFFGNVAKDLQNGNNSMGTSGRQQQQSMFLSPVTKNDVIIAIMNLKNKKCSGNDDVSDDILKKCHTEILEPLLSIIQESYQQGVYPERLKTSKILPLYKKKGEKEDVTNWRPVANITAFAKIFESIMNKKVRAYLQKFSILSESQFGFIENQSTANAIVDFIHNLYENIQSKKCVTEEMCYNGLDPI